MDSQRNEDLNPRSDDIEERVKQMLDPSIPDKPDPKKDSADKSNIPKPITIITPDEDEPAPQSAPVLPTNNSPDTKNSDSDPKPKKSKKISIPITHDSAVTDEPNETATPSGQDSNKDNPNQAEQNIQAIILDNEAKSPAEVAEKLDEAIAELDKDPKTPEIGTANAVPEDSEATKIEDSKQKPLEDKNPQVQVTDPAVITDPETDKAVEAIIAKESDELLEIEDALRDSDEPVVATKKQRRKLAEILKSWWAKTLVRWVLILLFLGGIVALGAVPSGRYFVLNGVGVRAASSLTVLDASTQQPLKNVEISVGNSSATTDVNGKAELRNIRLGSSLLTVQKRAFAPVTKNIVLGWGSNPLGSVTLTPTGSQYSFAVSDFLSGKPAGKVEASSGEASAISDDKGVIKLTIDKSDDQKLSITFKAENYRLEQLSLDPNDKSAHTVKLVPGRKQVFASKRSGKYDIYSVYIDGKDEKLVLSGSGSEREDNLVLVPHPATNVVAYVSNRAGQHNSDGYLLSNLILINADDTTTTNVVAAERIQIVDWSKDYLVYVQIASGTSANSPKRYRLMSYNYRDETSKELASSNFFNDVVAADGSIYYAPSSAYQTGVTNFYRVNPDGSDSQIVYNKEVWNIFRTSYDHLALSVQQQWYDYRLGAAAPTKLNSAPSNQATQVYINSPDGSRSAWVDNRDGKGVLLSYDTAKKSDATLRSQAGLTYPVRWLNDKVLVYRVKSPQETADYAISTDGGDPVKIRDVTNSGGIDRWYYY